MSVAGPSRALSAVVRSQRSLSLVRCLQTQSCDAARQLAFAFDIDGVLKQGHVVLPQARRVLQMLSGQDGQLRRPIPYLMITNGGGVTEKERREALSRDFGVEASLTKVATSAHGLQIGENQLVQSHTPLQDYVGDYADEPVLIVGGVGEAGRKVAESYGLRQAYILQDVVAWNPSVWDRYHLTPLEQNIVKHVDFSQIKFKAVFVIHDNGMDWGLATQVITEVLASNGGVLGTRGDDSGKQIPLVLTNPDFIWGSDYPLSRFGMGAFRIALSAIWQEMTGKELEYTQFGKPHTSTYAFAETMLRRHLATSGNDPETPLNVYMVGDNPSSDIAGANAHGWSSLLVKTGVFRDGVPAHPPTRIVEDVAEGVEWAIERESRSLPKL